MCAHDLETLRRAIRDGARPRYLYFWSHTPTTRDGIGKECLSQWYASEIVVDGTAFPTAEHYMMYCKAVLFGDHGVAEQVLRAPNPGAAKALGRCVRGFEETVWEQHRVKIVTDGNHAKFRQSPELQRFLLSTRGRILVEASPADRVWGIGLAADHEHASDPLQWRGLNLLGFALMLVRERLIQENEA
jgi:ribA/ribD-fused uncharacterized protein